MFLVFFSLLATALCNYDSQLFFPLGSNCETGYLAFVSDPSSKNCTTQDCQCGPTVCSIVSCNTTELPPQPSSQTATIQFYSGSTCTGQPASTVIATLGVCFSYLGGRNSSILTCSGAGVRYRHWSSPLCAGDPDQDSPYPDSACSENPAIYTSCSPLCFHKATTVGYQGKQMALTDLEASEECTIPHRVVSDGVKITTTCPGALRLTHRHLVMTPTGWEEAGNLKKGDFLYSQIHAEKADCEITSIESEQDQEYFGLNCYHSDVLADGIWVSTFGSQHHLPAAWMKYGGAILGIQRASMWGDYLASMFQKWGFRL